MKKVVLLGGDGIGPEIVSATESLLQSLSLPLSFEPHLIGGAAIDAHGDPLPASTLAACAEADAILLGAVGGPKWDSPTASVRPEQGLLRLRRELGLFANLRPVKSRPSLAEQCPLRADLASDVDMLFVRELTGGIYFGPRQEASETSADQAFDTLLYSRSEIDRIVSLAFRLSGPRKRHVTSVDKANVLASSRLWRRVAEEVAVRFPGYTLAHQLVDSCAMKLITAPGDFDVVVTGNMFGDILTDEASVLGGSLGLLPSASLGESGRGLYEPAHGSAPDIAGKGVANPLATFLSAAMMFRHSLAQPEIAMSIERAVDRVIDQRVWTPDIGGEASTTEVAEAVRSAIQ